MLSSVEPPPMHADIAGSADWVSAFREFLFHGDGRKCHRQAQVAMRMEIIAQRRSENAEFTRRLPSLIRRPQTGTRSNTGWLLRHNPQRTSHGADHETAGSAISEDQGQRNPFANAVNSAGGVISGLALRITQPWIQASDAARGNESGPLPKRSIVSVRAGTAEVFSVFPYAVQSAHGSGYFPALASERQHRRNVRDIERDMQIVRLNVSIL